MRTSNEKPAVTKDVDPFSGKMTPEDLQNVLWETLQKIRTRKMRPAEANAITMAAKEICSIARIQIQYRVLEGLEAHQKALPGK